MKTLFYLPLALLFFLTNSVVIQAQEVSPFNKVAIDFNIGANKPFDQFVAGYRTPTFNFVHIDIGARYMFNDKFGLKADFGYDDISSASESKEFNNNYLRGTIQGIVNLRNTLNIHDFSDKFGLLFHGGIGIATLRNENSDGFFNYKNNNAAEMLTFVFGFTPQYKVNDNLSINLDWSLYNNLYQTRNFDMVGRNQGRGFDGNMATLTLGISYFFGKASKSSDWYVKNSAVNNSRIDELNKRLQNAEKRIKELNN